MAFVYVAHIYRLSAFWPGFDAYGAGPGELTRFFAPAYPLPTPFAHPDPVPPSPAPIRVATSLPIYGKSNSYGAPGALGFCFFVF
jgi:hypothetical protein